MALYDSTTGSVNAFDSYHRHQVIIGNIRIPIFFRFTQNPNEFTFRLQKEYNETRTIGGYVYEMWGKKPQILKGRVTIKKDNSWSRVLGINDKMTNFDLEDHTYNPELMIFQTLFNIDQRRLLGFGESVSSTAKTAYEKAKKGVTRVADIVSSAYTSFKNWEYNKSGASRVCEVLAQQEAICPCNPEPSTEPVINPEPEQPEQTKKNYTVPSLDQYTTPDQTSVSGFINSFTDTIIYYKGNIYTGFFTKMDYKEDGKSPFVNVVNFEFLVTGTFLDWIDTQLTQTALGRTIAGIAGIGNTVFTGGSLVSSLVNNLSSALPGDLGKVTKKTTNNIVKASSFGLLG